MVQFPTSILKAEWKKPQWEDAAAKIVEDGRICVLIGKWEITTRLAASIIRLTHRGDQLVSVPMPATTILAQSLVDNFGTGIEEDLFRKYLVLDEQTMPSQFASKPNSYLIDKLHYAFNLLTIVLEKRFRHKLTTLILTETIVPYNPATLSFLSFFKKHCRVEDPLELKWENRKWI